MSFKMQRVHLFHAEVEDKPGGAAAKLKKLAEAGAHLEYVYSQRSATKPGMGDLFVAPLHGNGEMAAARAADDLTWTDELGLSESRKLLLERFERAYLERLLRETKGNISEAARRSGVDRSNLRRLLGRYGLTGGNE